MFVCIETLFVKYVYFLINDKQSSYRNKLYRYFICICVYVYVYVCMHVKFVNLLMNDTTYLLNESLAKLTKIRDIEKSMENHAVFGCPSHNKNDRYVWMW